MTMQNLPERSLKDFILGVKDQLEGKVEQFFTPHFSPGGPIHQQVFAHTRKFNKKPYLAQVAAIAALAKGFMKKRVLGLVAEMGSGKTLQGIYTSALLSERKQRPIRTLILCPSVLVSTWMEELEESHQEAVTIVDANGPECLAKLIELRTRPMIPDRNEFWIIGYNRMKTNAAWESKALRHPRKGLICPDCFKSLELFDGDGTGYEGSWALVKKRICCPHCGTPMWSHREDARRIYAPVLYIKKRLRRHFDFLVVDEVQKLKGGETIQGAVLGQLAEALPKTLILTGTLSGGKASDVFYLLQRAFALNYSREDRQAVFPPFSALKEFVEKYGTIEKTYRKNGNDALTGRASKETCTIRELPGISPLLLNNFFLENTVFLRISDISDALPAYSEILEFTELPDDLLEAYKEFESTVSREAKAALATKDMTVVGQMLSALMSWPDMPERAIAVKNRTGDVVAEAPALNIGQNTPKDDRLIECVRDANSKRRNCLIFAEYTGFGALEYLEKRLKDADLRVLVMRPSIPTHRRLDWIRTQMASGKYDNLLCHPKLVETGMNLREFPEILFWETGFSTYLLRQASRRSWRPGQTQDVVVRFFITRGTIQENAMCHIASKLEGALLLEGELSDKGLVALSSNNSGIAELARELAGVTTNEQSLEKVFASYRALENQVQASASQLAISFDDLLDPPSGGVQENSATSVPLSPETRAGAESEKKRDSSPSLADLVRKLVIKGELVYDDSHSGPYDFKGRIGRKPCLISDRSIVLGTQEFPVSGNLQMESGCGLLLNEYVLIEQPRLFGSSYLVYGAA
jgi:hypothetical protein